MAALPDIPPTYATAVLETARQGNERLTHSYTPEAPVDDEPDFPGSIPTGRGRTGSDIELKERGHHYRSERNVGEFGGRSNRTEGPETGPSDGETVRLRSEVARDIRSRVSELIPLVGNLSFATHLQLLKRDLSRCHDLLHDRPSESIFLSVVTLIESAISQLKWKEYTAEQLELIRMAADLGYRKTQVSFANYDDIRRQFATRHINTHPRIDLDAFSLDDLADDDEEEL